jgi:hypothetical protein
MPDAHIILAGQSNALGFGNTGPAPYTPTAQVQIWADTNADGIGDAWNYMNPGVNTGTAANPGAWGPEVSLANEWLADNATGYLWIVKSTKGSTALAQEAGLDWSHLSSGEMFDLTEAAVDAARANLNGSAFAFAQYDALMWMQGEDDALDALQAAAYQTNLHDFAAAARLDWNVGEVIVGRITDSASLPYGFDVRVGQWSEDQADAAMVSFKTIGFTMQADGVHYAAAGHVQLGSAFYDAWVL